MLAVVEKVDRGYIAKYDRLLNHPVEKVWTTLTQNEELKNWMPNLEIKALQPDGRIQFNMNDGTGNSFDLRILDYKAFSYLQYEWGEGWVRFELHPKDEGCYLTLNELIPSLSNHTPKDLAGWHVCLDLFYEVLEGRVMDFPKEEWKVWYERYTAFVQSLNS
ncbi:SRPBCC family protein [Marininema halotolerans]|uniref:Uncharacterized conserved protein YndB, AHSA1/START domain n=1 Tax=Marininema halotolerans TaxID=1155944 RepID=A0A1I6R706_9BACL|nr:SRPBCC family protein [Marininema halotolerans]SFS60456.1 Uncharacterized conserved protein YndB, AHSA1/START domain [Marininema halotolerans]